jgi:hypothetical protein
VGEQRVGWSLFARDVIQTIDENDRAPPSASPINVCVCELRVYATRQEIEVVEG